MGNFPEESSVPVSGPSQGDVNDAGNERLSGFDVEGSKLEERNERGVVGWRRNSSWRRTTSSSRADMRVSRTCRFGLSAPFVLWTSVCLILLAGGASCGEEEQTRISRSPKYGQETEVPGGLTPQEAYNVVQFLRDLFQKHHQQMSQRSGQPISPDEDFSDIDWRKIPLPLLYHIRALLNEGSKEEDKRGSYMSLCHFKICNLG